MKTFYLHIVCLLLSCGMLAQDTIYELTSPVIIDSFNRSFNQYNQLFTTDEALQTIYTGGPLSEALRFTASGISRSSGPGKVTTFTKHGLPTEHTVVSWNKLALNSSLNGIVDFSTLPSFLLSNQSSLGEQFARDVHLFSQTNTNTLDVLFQIGAFQHINAGIKHAATIGNSKFSVGGEYVTSKNDIGYLNDLGQAVKQTNGAYEQFHGAIGFEHELNSHSGIRLNLMYSDISTEIPPTIFQKNSTAYQQNDPLKIAATYHHHKGDHHFDIDYGTIHEKLNYVNSTLNLDATHLFNRHNLQVNWKYFSSAKTMFGLRLNESAEYGSSDHFSGTQSSINTDAEAFISTSFTDKLLFSTSVGIQHGRSVWSPLNYRLKTTYLLNNKNRIRLSVESLFRLPTYNERFWEPGGNLKLKPENGHAVVADYFFTTNNVLLEIGGSLHRLNNRILWLPSNAGYFSPINVGKVGSEELYGGLTWRKSIARFNFSAGLRYTFLNAHIISSPNARVEGNAIPFTPTHSFNQHASLKWNNKWTIKFLGAYQSRSYISTDNTNFLSEFYLLQSELRYTATKNRLHVVAFLRLNNLTNTSYFLTSGYPQAERHGQFGFIFSLN